MAWTNLDGKSRSPSPGEALTELTEMMERAILSILSTAIGSTTAGQAAIPLGDQQTRIWRLRRLEGRRLRSSQYERGDPACGVGIGRRPRHPRGRHVAGLGRPRSPRRFVARTHRG